MIVASACVCVNWSAKDLAKNAQVIFVGTIIDNSCADENCPSTNSYPTKLVTFKVEKYWKGQLDKETKISMPAAVCCICGIETKIGEQLLVYAFGSGYGYLVMWSNYSGHGTLGRMRV